MDFFNAQIHIWYSLYKRDLPWRNNRDPYSIWLSEIILQQTRIDQGLTYYNKFLDEFPEISDLASASEDQVLKLWQGLGYYSRARNLHSTAKFIQNSLNGKFPEDFNTILSLKGIGDYTAAAIASMSFNLEHPVLDGNVFRVLARYFGISEPTDTAAGKKIFKELAKELIKGTDPGMHNQALMEFGALQCTPRNPNCSECPIHERCFAFSFGKIIELPVKKNKTKQRERFFNYLVLSGKNCTWLRKRTEDDIWKNLFEFPPIETSTKTEIEELVKQNEFRDIVNEDQDIIENVSNWKVHILSHQRIHYRFIRIHIFNEILVPDEFIRVNKEDIFNFAIPKLLETYIHENRGSILFT
ncbi:MAG: A/G-specific adenine glycosylase [Bacteroidia bacterium]